MLPALNYIAECFRASKVTKLLGMLVLVYDVYLRVASAVTLPAFLTTTHKISFWCAILLTVIVWGFVFVEGGYRLHRTVRPKLEIVRANRLRFSQLTPDPNTYVLILDIENTEKKAENVAEKVSVALEFESFDRKRLKAEGAWMYPCFGSQDKWTKQISIGMGRSFALPVLFWVQNPPNYEYYLLDTRNLIINPHGLLTGNNGGFKQLAFGEWNARLKMKGDNYDGSCSLKVNLSPTQGLKILEPMTIAS